MKKLALFLSLTFTLLSAAHAAYVVKGTVSAEGGQSTQGIPVVLIEQNPNKPPQGPVAMSQTEEGGAYRLELESVDQTSQYVVGARLGETRGASAPFSFAQPTQTVNFTLPAPAPAQEGAGEARQDEVVPGPFVFEGQLKAEPGFSLAGASIQLVEMTMTNPEGRVVAQGRTNGQGRFSVPLPVGYKHSLYYLSAELDRRVAGSEPATLKAGVKRIVQELTFLPVSSDPSQLSVEKNLYFFELMDDAVRVSEILLVENLFEGTLDLRAKPFAKQLPNGATNFQLMRADGSVSAEEANGKAFLSLALNPGRGQIFLSYDLPKQSLGAPLEAQLLPNTKEVELVRTSLGFELNFLADWAQNVVESKKGHGQEVFFSKKALAVPGQDKVAFEVEVSLIPQKRLFYPATLLLVLLLCGLFWYVKIKPQAEA